MWPIDGIHIQPQKSELGDKDYTKEATSRHTFLLVSPENDYTTKNTIFIKVRRVYFMTRCFTFQKFVTILW